MIRFHHEDMKNKLIFIAVCVFVVCAVLLGFFFNQRQSDIKPVGVQKTKLAIPAVDGRFAKSPSASTYGISPSISFPSTAPVYSFSRVSQKSALLLADSLRDVVGIKATPSSIIKGDVYERSWEGQNLLFFVVSYSSKGTVYMYNKPLIKQGENNSFHVSVDRFLSVISSALEMRAHTVKTDNSIFDGLLILDRPKPRFYTEYQVQFEKEGNFIATDDMSPFAGTIIVDNNNIVRYAKIALPYLPTKQSGVVSTLTKEQIIESLSAGRGVTLNIGRPSDQEVKKKTTFTSFNITSARFFYSPSNRYLLPAMYLSGEGGSMGGNQQATFFLWNFAATQ